MATAQMLQILFKKSIVNESLDFKITKIEK